MQEEMLMNQNTIWKVCANVEEITSLFPAGSASGDPESTPDVYGKVIRFYSALKDADNNNSMSKEVILWRGLVTLLAMQKYLGMPLAWRPSQDLSGSGNIFAKALLFPPKINRSSNTKNKWNGTDFYVLRWEPYNYPEEAEDVLLYSPATLVYPTADWPGILSGIPHIKWFNYRSRQFFDPVDKLAEPEKKIVYFWLDQMANKLQNSGNTCILHHLDEYKKALGVQLTVKEAGALSMIEMTAFEEQNKLLDANFTVDAKWRFGNGTDAVSISVSELFSEQICYFSTKEPPFQMCSNISQYKIKDTDKYAFLPISDKLREKCCQFHLADGLKMASVKDHRNEEIIRVTMSVPPQATFGIELVKEYRVSDKDDYSSEKNIAVPYNNSDNSCPLIAIWPHEICDLWKSYFILLEEASEKGKLSIRGGIEQRNGSVQITRVDYVPDAIPIIWVYPNHQERSVGLITPLTSPGKNAAATVSADVAVDLGTSATKIFARTSVNKEMEISIADDEPLVVTCGSARALQLQFIPPVGNSDKELFSIYKRRDRGLNFRVEPILDGIIYQPRLGEKLADTATFMTDLKWQVSNQQAYYTAFIKQLCIHVIRLLNKNANVNKINWLYALPASMDDKQAKQICEVWQEIGTYLSEEMTSIQNTVASNFVMESAAASRYFLFDPDENANAAKGYLVVDIGGGSTDIALWQGARKDPQMRWHASVKVAGRKMFTVWIRQYLGNLSVKAAGQAEKQTKGLLDMVNALDSPTTKAHVKDALVDRILNAYYKPLKKGYFDQCACDDSEWGRNLRSHIRQALSLLTFALGCQIGHFIHEGTLIIPVGPGSFDVAFGGKGGQMLQWLKNDNGNYRDMEAFFHAGITFENPSDQTSIAVTLSKHPKSEVAKGMLENSGSTSVFTQVACAPAQECTPDYLRMFEYYKEVYVREYPEETLPEVQTNHLVSALGSYKGDLKEIVNVFMEAIYVKFFLAQGQGGPGDHDTTV